ncbi:hypothetical protein BDV26DRAFT_228312 [Aspergillus bertholletiae]|uniref:Uncharacterized protein n=1 Tax=Aspergillus bertholletiae TaxID=1226010 RepID=A0A5N7B403_9EURO|nr:hypothetical protein BDV26DRAFT_228312 [Aspergillus bertholletiae]
MRSTSVQCCLCSDVDGWLSFFFLSFFLVDATVYRIWSTPSCSRSTVVEEFSIVNQNNAKDWLPGEVVCRGDEAQDCLNCRIGRGVGTILNERLVIISNHHQGGQKENSQDKDAVMLEGRRNYTTGRLAQ